MTYPPQQPGPYGGPPPPGYGQDPWRQQGPYQGGFPTQPFPAAPPPRNTGKIVAIVLIALLLLGGVGAGVYFLTRGTDEPTAGGATTAPPVATTTKAPADQTPDAGPETVVDEYIEAYEKKSFGAVTAGACNAYKKKYGTDTTQLDDQLKKYTTITGAAQGAPEVRGNVAVARIALKLTTDAEVKDLAIEIKIVKEDGEWRFCGEETA